MPAASPEDAWACYEDLWYGFAIEHPAGWRGTISIHTGLQNDVKITRRHELWGPQGAADVDIWHPTDPNLTAWLTKYRKKTGPDLVRLTEPNARVAGYPAVAFVMGKPQNPSPMLTVYVSNKQYIYRLWFTLTCDREEIPIIRRMLDTFRFSAQLIPVEIPEEVWQEVQRAFEPPRCAPPPPTPGPVPTPRPVILPSAKEVQQLTEGWPAFEDSGLGVRFKYPADYQVHPQENLGLRTLSIVRPVENAWETFLSLFFWEYKGLPMATADDLLKWEASLPPEMDPVGGRVWVIGELSLPQMGRGWVIRWEPLPGNSEVVVDSVVLPLEERIIWVNLSKPASRDLRLEDVLWSQQMAFLTTLEVFR